MPVVASQETVGSALEASLPQEAALSSDLAAEVAMPSLDRTQLDDTREQLMYHRAHLLESLREGCDALTILLDPMTTGRRGSHKDEDQAEYALMLLGKLEELRDNVDSLVPGPFPKGALVPPIDASFSDPSASREQLEQTLQSLRPLLSNEVVNMSPLLQRELSTIVGSLEVMLEGTQSSDRWDTKGTGSRGVTSEPR